ncbi:GntR family transcriptional regulator [Rubellimicrobium rubrum]|uniref:GntR family transcriptional regulator n=1 Tax=Rubellimicrobium rubrum TaxID=2585369 RepID=A0A5C4N034_9RHOB|nr:GntR family transcriptional regulator [Rubellimicrobium rubrum]TNC50550.1 GntR family transcriptional regulator [Rubellimicrobium rubrum]
MVTAPTPLALSLANQLVEQLRAGGLEPGQRVTERKLAQQFRVSRSPVRSALQLLAQAGVLIPGDRGYEIAAPSAADAWPLLKEPPDEEEVIYRRIADERLSGSLPERITESEFLRRYSLTRARLARLLRRMTQEGWIERLPGHGWTFLPVLTSLEAYEDSYRFRQLIEPAALLEPRWTLDRPALQARRTEQLWLVNGGIFEVSDAKLFELNSGLHETIMECSRNAFLIESLRRVDRLRRLIEYRQTLDRKVSREQCLQHVEILDLVLAGRNEDASTTMRRHLGKLRGLKASARDEHPADPEADVLADTPAPDICQV